MYTIKKTMTFLCIFLLSSPLYAFADGTVTNVESANTIGSLSDGKTYSNDFSDITATNGAVYHNLGSNIIISGIFENNTANENGGVIYNEGSFASLESTFKGNSADLSGGALYNKGTIEKIISTFTNNIATENGGAMYNAAGDITSIQGTFSGNNALENGGAIYNASTANIGTIEASFTKNIAGKIEDETDGNTEKAVVYSTATISNGGAIYNAGSIENIKLSFTENHADTDGGAIYNLGNITNLNATFTKNTASNYGGALYNANQIITITSNFYNNIAVYGGAIYNEKRINSIENTTFKGNTSTTYGGAIFNKGTIDNISANFVENKSDVQGGAIYNNGTISITDSTFTGNEARYGGAIRNTGTINEILFAIFTSNKVSNQGGAILNSADIVNISATFNQNNANTGGAIYNTGTITTLSAFFTGNIANSNGGAIFNSGTIGTVSGSFIDNTAANKGGAIYTTGNIAFVADNTTNIFTNNMANEEYNAIYVGADNIDLSFTMTGTGSYILNDSIVGSSGYNLAIRGEDKEKNIFNLNNTISNLSSLEVDKTSLILSRYTQNNGTTTIGTLDFEEGASVNITNSHLSVDMAGSNTLFYSDDIDDDIDNGAFNVDTDSTLYLTNVAYGKLTIASGFNVQTSWDLDNISLGTDLLTIEAPAAGVSLLSSSTSSINIGFNEDNNLFKSAYGDIIKDSIKSDDFSANSKDATTRFIYGATLDSVGSTDKRESIIFAASDIAALAGVNTSGKSAMLAGKNTIKPRYNFSSANINNGMTRLVTYNEDGSIKDEYDNVIELASSQLIRFPVVKNYSTSLWFMPMYAHERINDMSAGNNTNTYKTNIFGAAIGADRTVRGESTDQYRIGLSGNIGMGKTSPSGDFDNISNSFDFYGGAVYGAFQRADLLFSLDIGYSKNISELMQDLSSVSMNSTTANIETGIWHGALHVGYIYPIMGVNITPYTGVELLSIKNLDYKVEENSAEGGDIFNVTSERQNVFSIPLGIKVDTNLAIQDWAISPNASLAAIISMGDLNEYTSVSTTTSFDNAIILESQIIDKNTIDIGLGVQASKNKMKYALDINSEISANRKVFGLSGKAEFSF